MNRKKPLIMAGIFLGIGMGGFVDGILFHQILQIHNMLSAKFPVNTLVNAEINMVWDGIFHVLTWITTAKGVYLLWQAGKNPDIYTRSTLNLGKGAGERNPGSVHLVHDGGENAQPTQHEFKVERVYWSGKIFWGGLWLGWGLFNLVEGIIDHHILGIHHVVERLGVSIYDYSFLGSGILFIILGIKLISLGKQDIVNTNSHI